MNSSSYRVKKKTVLISTGLFALCLSKVLMASMPQTITVPTVLKGYINSGEELLAILAWGIVITTFFIVVALLVDSLVKFFGSKRNPSEYSGD